MAYPPTHILCQRFWDLIDTLEERGLLSKDATFEEFEALMARLEREHLLPVAELPPSSDHEGPA